MGGLPDGAGIEPGQGHHSESQDEQYFHPDDTVCRIRL